MAPFNPQGEEYPPRSPSRSQYVNTVCQFLEFCVDELGFDEKWSPPSSRRKLRGGRGAHSQRRSEDRQPNAGKAIPFPEDHIPALLDDFPKTRFGRQWRLAIGFLICFGIRGVELKYLRWEDGQLWSDYVKVNQAGETEPRILIGIDPAGMPGLSEQLIAEWTSGVTQMPPMRATDSNTSIAILTYLNRRPFWSALRKSTMEKGRRLSIYSFRHRYAKTLDAQKFPTRASAMLMGHTRATFEKSYGNSELSPNEATPTAKIQPALERISLLRCVCKRWILHLPQGLRSPSNRDLISGARQFSSRRRPRRSAYANNPSARAWLWPLLMPGESTDEFPSTCSKARAEGGSFA